MCKFLCVVLWSMASTCASAQSFDFSRMAATDPLMLEKAMPMLAAQVSESYKEDDRAKYLDHAFKLQIVSGKYEDALVTIATRGEPLLLRTPPGNSPP